MLEQFKNSLPDKITHLNEQKATKLFDSGVLADNFVLTHKDRSTNKLVKMYTEKSGYLIFTNTMKSINFKRVLWLVATNFVLINVDTLNRIVFLLHRQTKRTDNRPKAVGLAAPVEKVLKEN